MAKKYIDADRYCANLREMKTNEKNTVYEYYDDGIDLAISEAAIFPAADVVDVVRCKDCKWGRKVCGNIECFVDRNIPPEYHGYEWFCPNGERRTDE